jgi:glutamate--cysteine ligase catalytic subunit
MTEKQYPKEQVARVNNCLQFVLDRSKGRIPTGANYIRRFVQEHPEYQRDSFVSNKIAFDLVSKIASMNYNEEERQAFYGKKFSL